MTTAALRLLITFGLFIIIDIYAYQAFRTAFRFKLTPWVYWGLTVALVVLLIYSIFQINQTGSRSSSSYMYVFGVMILLYVPKIAVAFFLLAEDLFRVFHAGWTWALNMLPTSEANLKDEITYFPERRKFISQLAIGAAAIPFFSILYGMTKGKYNFRVIRQTLTFDDLPEEFDGFTIAQLSDIHSGSFDNRKMVEYGVDLVNEQNPDLILFTGDIVNNTADELEPWVDTFAQLKAANGKLSILGNHDYGDYVGWDSPESKRENLEHLFGLHKKIGFDLLRNEHRTIERNGKKLYIAGVENWGLPPFPQYGDLEKSTREIPDDGFTVLMSHDPSHYDAEVKKWNKKIHLTLSGHTHGMQFGIEIPGFRWSPVKYRYPKWAGLYEEAGRFLYVNRGFGYLAFPGRVGIWPEVTMITLRKGNANQA